MLRTLGALLMTIGLGAAARGDDFVDVISNNVWVRKDGLACDSASAAAEGGTGLFSGCTPMPYAVRVKLVETAEPAAQVYHMRVIGLGERPLTAWFSRSSLTNAPPPGDFGPVQ